MGARTAVGMTAPATAAAARAGIAGFTHHPFAVDTAGKPFVVGWAADPSAEVSGAARLAELAGPAAAEALAPAAGAAGGKSTVPVFVGLPPVRPGRPADAAAAVAERLRRELTSVGLPPGRVQTIETGHAAGAMAVRAAWEAVRTGAAFALAGGVDSYTGAATLEWLEANEQIHSAGADNNAWGFIPGEGAGFVFLASAPAVEQRRLTAALELLTAATTRETKLIRTDTVCLGEGLSALYRALAAGLPPGVRTDDLLCDMNGERYRADEFGFATIRDGERLLGAPGFTAPASCWGDVGAASGPLFIGLADAATRKGYAKGPVTAAFTSSESGERCGFVLRAQAPHGGR